MSLKEVVVEILQNDPVITAVVGSRIYPNALPQSAIYPALAYDVDYAQQEGNLTSATNFVRATVTLTALAYTEAQADPLRARLLVLIGGLRGQFGDVKITYTRQESATTTHNVLMDGSDDRLVQIDSTFALGVLQG